MERHINALAKASLVNVELNRFDKFNSYKLPLYLLKLDPQVHKKELKSRDKSKKTAADLFEPALLMVEGVREEFRKIKRFKTYAQRWDKYLHPVAESKYRIHYFSTVLEALANDDIEAALKEVDNLPADFLCQDEFWGKVVEFIIAALSGEQEYARALTQTLYNMAQCEHNPAILANLMPLLCLKYLESEYYPWQMQSRTVDWQNETYYCEPVYVHNLDAYGGEEYLKQTPVKQRGHVARKHDAGYVYAYDRHGNKTQSVATAAANVSIVAVKAVGQVAAATILAGVAGGIYLALAGKIKAYHYRNSNNKMIFKRSVEIPVNSCGYIVSKQSSALAAWADEYSSESVNLDFAFLNFVDGEVYPCRKGYDVPDAEALIELLCRETAQ